MCFEDITAVHCRGTDDDTAYYLDFGDQGMADIGDRGPAKYPWKLFYGAHLIYYF